VHAHHREAAARSSAWVRERLAGAHFATPWGSVELARAACALFAEAVRDDGFDAEYLALASETCLPVATPRELAAALFDDDDADDDDAAGDDDDKARRRARLRSWVAAFDRPDNGYAVEKQWARVAPALPPECVWKAPQWVLLTRAHARLTARAVDVETRRAHEADDGGPRRQKRESAHHGFKGRRRHNRGRRENGGSDHADDDAVEAWRLFARVTAADELYFPSLLALTGELVNRARSTTDDASGAPCAADDAIEAPRVARRRLTWCDWSLRGRSPATLPHLTPDLIRQARQEGCLFARKFPPGAVRDPAHWDALVAEAAATQEDEEPRVAKKLRC